MGVFAAASDPTIFAHLYVTVSYFAVRRSTPQRYVYPVYTTEWLHVFYVLWTVHLGTVLFNDQLDAQFLFCICLFQFSTCFEQPCVHHQESQLYQYDIWYMSLYVVTYTR